MKKLILGLMMAFAANAAMAEMISDVQIDGLKYTLDTEAKSAAITGYTGSPTQIDVSQVKYLGETYAVTEVLPEAFNGCASLRMVSLPQVSVVGELAFNCPKLTFVYLPNTTTIGDEAFSELHYMDPPALPPRPGEPVPAQEGTWIVANDLLSSLYVSSGMKSTIEKNGRLRYGIPDRTTIKIAAFDSTNVVIEPCPDFCSTAKVYTNGVEVTVSPILVLLNATVDVVFTADDGYCFKDSTTVQTNTVQATGNLTVVLGPETFSKVVTILPSPAEHSTAKVYANGVEVAGFPIFVLAFATVDVVFTADDGYGFVDDYSTVQTNTVTATEVLILVAGTQVVKLPSLSKEMARQAGWETETTITVVSAALKSGDTTLDKGEYESACEFYGITPKTEPTAEDFKAVDKDAQVVQEGEIAVKKESIAAPSAVTVKVEENKVQLGVAVLKTSDLTAEKKDWSKVKLTKEDIDVDADGNIIVNVPVDSQSGFMVIQTKDAKVGD